MSSNQYCYTLQSIMSRFKVQGFPTIMVFGVDKSSPYAYDGARSASAIESFATELVESSAGPVEVTELTGPVWSRFHITSFFF